MKYIAKWNGQVIAETDAEQILRIEGNIYFPPDSINRDFYKTSEYQTECPWKGIANYYTIEVNGESNPNAAWYYPEPRDGSIELVAKQNNGNGDFSGYVAFWNGVDVTQED